MNGYNRWCMLLAAVGRDLGDDRSGSAPGPIAYLT